MAKKKDRMDGEPVAIKKYANRRLYHTGTSSYVTLDHLCQMVKDGEDFVVRDAQSGEDITRSVLTQIIFEEESKGQTLLPVPFLRQLIGFYGDTLESVVPNYLQATMDAFAENQDQLKRSYGAAFDPEQSIQAFTKLAEQNMAMFENAAKMFSPFMPGGKGDERAPEKSGEGAQIQALQDQLAALQEQITSLSKK